MTARQTARRIAARAARTHAARSPLRWVAQRGLVPEPVCRHLPPGEPTFRIGLGNGRSFRYTAEPNDPFVRQLYWRGTRCDEAASLLAFASEAGVGDGLVVDVGAHTGLYTLAALAAADDVEVTAFEPVPSNVALLAENLALNGWSKRCTIRQAAVSDTSGTAEFHVPLDDHPMSASLETTGFRGLAGELVEVEVISLDDALAGQRLRIVKIDVEGFEDKVLEGASEILRLEQPRIMIECNPDGPVENVELLLRQHGYRFLLLDGTTAPPLDHIRVDATERFRNTLCLPPGSTYAGSSADSAQGPAARAVAKLRKEGVGATLRRAAMEVRDLAGLARYRMSGRRSFELDGRRFPIFVRHYNTTWRNERGVEISLARDFLARHGHGRGLEIGNVLAHYGPIDHEVVDKYETAPGVRNEDVVDLVAEPAYDYIVAISTLEHVGWDETPRDPDKVHVALERLRLMLVPTGRLFVSCPLGYNPNLDKLIRARALDSVSEHFLARRGAGWREVDVDDVADPPPFEQGRRQAHAVWVAEFEAEGS